MIPKNARVIALDERGKDLTSVALAKNLTDWQQDGRDVVFVIMAQMAWMPNSRPKPMD